MIDICTKGALRELVTPALLAVLAPVVIGFGISDLALGGFLAAAILTSQLMAAFMNNAGGAWDNAKKYIEEGHLGGKGSEAHKAAVVGDTVGDPFKDTAGPAFNPLMKCMNLVSLLVLPTVITLRNNNAARYSIAAVALVIVAVGVAYSKRKVASDGRYACCHRGAGERCQPSVRSRLRVSAGPDPSPPPMATAGSDLLRPWSRPRRAPLAPSGRLQYRAGGKRPSMPKPLVIVESPAKAKTIAGFLGYGYMVESSIGHIRDLPRNAADIPAAYKGGALGAPRRRRRQRLQAALRRVQGENGPGHAS